MYQRVKS